MGIRNYLVEGLSGTGKTTVCDALLRRGMHAVHGDRVLAYQGDPVTGAPVQRPVQRPGHAYHVWDVDRLRALVADRRHAASFFCGGARNFPRFIDLFDEIFVLEADWATLSARLAARPETEWGGRDEERALIRRLHARGGDVPQAACTVDATQPVERVVDTILARCDLPLRP